MVYFSICLSGVYNEGKNKISILSSSQRILVVILKTYLHCNMLFDSLMWDMK